MIRCLFFLLVLAVTGCKERSSEEDETTQDSVEVHKAPPPPGTRAVLTTQEDFFKEVQGKWVVTTDSAGTLEIRDRTISFDGNDERMPFTVSWDPCNDELEQILTRRYAGQQALYISMEAGDGKMKCIAMLHRSENQFTLSDEEGRSEATYKRVGP
jgi:hypothetical protein